MKDYSKIFSRNLKRYCKRKNTSIEELTMNLNFNINEFNNLNPTILVEIVKVLDISIDELFMDDEDIFTWNDDGITRVRLYKGLKEIYREDLFDKYTFRYDGEINNIDCACNIKCTSITGDAEAKNTINCETINGNVKTCGNCESISINGNVEAMTIKCGVIQGNASASNSIVCDAIEGDVSAEEVTSRVVKGNINQEKSKKKKLEYIDLNNKWMLVKDYTAFINYNIDNTVTIYNTKKKKLWACIFMFIPGFLKEYSYFEIVISGKAGEDFTMKIEADWKNPYYEDKFKLTGERQKIKWLVQKEALPEENIQTKFVLFLNAGKRELESSAVIESLKLYK